METIIFAKDLNGDLLVMDGDVLSQNLIPMRDIDLDSKRISFEKVYISEIEVWKNNNNFMPGIYRIIYAKNLYGLEKCQYKKVDLKKYPLLIDLDFYHGILFDVL